MAEIALITKWDIQQYVYISDSFQDERLNTYILQSQRLKLRELLRPALYHDLFQNVTNIDTITAPYDALVNGEEYEIIDNEPIQFYGLKPYLAYACVCVILQQNNLRLADYGNISYVDNPQLNMDKVSRTDRRDTMKSLHEIATYYRNDVVQYLNEKYQDFPLWEGNSLKKKKYTMYDTRTLR